MHIKINFHIIPIACFFVILAAATAFANEPAEKLPSAFLPERVYTFDSVPEGNEVVHDFILQNRGGETLNIIKLKSG